MEFTDFTGLKQSTDDLEEKRSSIFKPTQQSQTFDNLDGLSPDPVQEREVTRQAVTVNPDQFKQKLDASRKTGLPMSVVEQDTGELQNSLRAQELMNKLKDSPYSRKWFGLPNNAKVAHDDVDSLTTSEAVAKSAYGQLLTNAFSFNRFVDRVTTALSAPTNYISENITAFLFGDEAAKEYRKVAEQRPGLATSIMDVGDVIYEALGIRDEAAPKTSSYAADPLKAKKVAGVTKAVEEKLTSWDNVKDRPVEDVLPFIVQQGLISLPDMAMAIVNLPAYAAAQAERIAAQRAKNDGRTTATFGDFIRALPAATASAFLERLGARGMLGLDDALKEVSAKGVAQAAGKAAVKEGATEFAQGIIEKGGETIGTKKPFNIADAVDEAIGGMVAGSGFGGSVRGVTASVEATVKARVTRRRADQLRELNGLNSNLRERDPEAWAGYQAGLMEEYGVDRVRLSDEGINILLQEVDNLPSEQADLFRLPDNLMDGSATGSGADLKPEDFWSLPKETIDKLAEHISFDVNEVSANEAQEIADLTEMATREEFIKEVEQTMGDLPATDALVQEIEGRLMETGGALSGDPAAARAAAQQMAAVFSTMARRTGVPLETIQRRFLPRIERVTGAGPVQPGQAMLQDVINLEDVRERKKLEDFHAQFMEDLKQRARESMASAAAHEWSVEVGEKIMTETGIRTGSAPWTVAARTIQKTGLSPDADPQKGVFTKAKNVPYLLIRREGPDGVEESMVPEWAVARTFRGPSLEQTTLFQEGASLFENPLPVTPTGNNNRILIKDIGQALTDDHTAQVGEKLFPEDNPDHFQQVLEMAITEMDAQLERENSGVGWYGKDVNDAINTTAENLFPTLLTEPGHRDFFLILAGIFSNGTNPSQAWGISAGAYEIFLEGGVVPVQRRNVDGTPVEMSSYKDKKTGEKVTKPAGWGVRNPANEQHLQFFKHLVETQGGLQEAADWMLAEHTPAEINEMMLASGAFKAGKYKTKKELAGAPDRGVMVFGPKLGRYTMGLLGVDIDANDTTVDLWYTRTFRRWTGRLMDPPLGNEGVAAQPDPKNDEAERKSIFRLTEELSVRYGIDPGDVQAALWFFEKRLWATHGAQLDEGTNSQGAAKLLADRGIDVAERGDQPGAAVTEAALEQQAAGTDPLFQEVDFAGDVIFEVAPDPNNVELSSRWNALPPEVKLSISDAVSKSVLPAALEAAGADGSVFAQIGSYLDDTNPSFSLRLTSGDPAAVARAVGFVLSQDSMVALSADAFEGSFEAGAIRIQIGEKSLQEIDAIYQTLRGIEGFPQIGGQSTVDGEMTLILEEGVDRAAFARAVDKALTSVYTIETTTVNAAFPEKKDYDYASERDDPAGAEGVARQRYRAVRDQASREVAAAIDRYEQGGQPPAQQREGVTARGSIDLGAAEGIVIRLYDAENLSTFLHESGHLYLEMLGAFAEDTDAPQQIKDDFATVLKWLGVGSRAEIGREQHERWAETYEQYLREGKAPSEELRSAFAKFTAWLTTLYRRISRTGSLPRAALNKDISDVMDRLLASDEQIAVVRDEMRMAPMFKDAEAAGLTEAEFTQYKADYEAAREAQQDELTQSALAEIRRERTKRWNEELSRESKRILDALNEDPVWRARSIMQQGALPNGDTLPEVYPARLKLDKKMAAEYGYDLPGGNQLFARDGVNPERAAQDLGYSSADQLLRELSELPKSEDGKFLTAKQFADKQAREYMLQQHGDLMDADQMHEEALNKVHSRRQAQIILDELRLLSRKAGRTNQVSNRAARTAAENTMREKTIAQLGSPTKYLNAERRFAMKAAEAVIVGDIDAALRFKTQQLLNFHMYRQARDLRSKSDRMIARMADYSRRKFDPTKMHPEYIQQVKALLGDVNFSGKMSARRFATLSAETLQQWADQQSEKFGASFHISPELDRALTKQNVRDFTFVELEGMHDTARSLVTQGRRYSDAETAQFDQMVRNMGYSIDANATKVVPVGRERTKWDSVKGFVRLAFAEHRTILSLSEELDGYELGGPVYTEVYQRIKRADDAYIDRSMKAAKAINDILSAYTRKERLSFFRKKRIPEINDSLSLNARLAFALNMGNPGNVSALKEEYTDAQIDGVLATLTDKDWDVVESIWEYIDTYWDDLSALEKRTTGVSPAKIAPSPFTLPSGRVIKGGYYPLVADPNRSARGKENYDASHSLKHFSAGGRAKTSTKHGSTIERKGFGDKPVWLDLRVLFEHVDGVIRDIEMREAVADSVRVIRSKPFSDSVTNAKGVEFYDMFSKWIEHTVAASKPPTTTVEKIFHYLRTGSSIAEMGLSVRTALMQPFGYTSSIALIGEKYAAKGMLKFAAQRGRAAQEVMEASAFMRNRAATFNREVRETNRWLGTDSLKNDLVTASFWGIQKLDMAVSIPTWLGAYDKAKDEGMSHDNAVDYADNTVARTQGSGLPRNMADIQQGPVWKKMFTMFYSYFGAYQNMQTDLWKQTSFRNPAQALKFAKAQIWLTVVPSLLVDALFNNLFGEDDDDTIYQKMAGSLLRQTTGGVVFLRDAINAATTGFNYQPTPAGNPIKELANLSKQIGQNEVDAPLVKSLIMSTGYMLHVPGARAGARATSVLMDDGDTFEFDEFESWWRLLVTGPKRK